MGPLEDHRIHDCICCCSCKHFLEFAVLYFLMAMIFIKQARYLVSADTQLKEIGEKTKIPYAKSFRAYRKLLSTPNHRNRDLIRSIFAYFDKHVFAGTNKGKAAPSANVVSVDEELAAVFEEMEVAGEDDEEPVDIYDLWGELEGPNGVAYDYDGGNDRDVDQEHDVAVESDTDCRNAAPGPSGQNTLEELAEAGVRTRSSRAKTSEESATVDQVRGGHAGRGGCGRGGKKKSK